MTVNDPETGITYYTTEDLAKKYRTSLSTIRYWRQIGTGPTGVRVGRRVLYAEHEVAAFDRARAEQEARRRSRVT